MIQTFVREVGRGSAGVLERRLEIA